MKRIVIALISFLMATSASAEVQKKDVDITTSDGVTLKATYFSPGRSGPAMLLLHQCNMDRHAWDTLAADLAGVGIHVVAVDYRGYGESGGEKITDQAQRREMMQRKWPGDIDAAYEFLMSQKDVDKAHVAASDADGGAAQSIKDIVEASKNPHSTVNIYGGSEHGVPMFAKNPELEPIIVNWLKARLAVKGSTE